MKNKKYVYDTSALILYPKLLEIEGQKIFPYIVLEELDNLKIGNNDVAYKARKAIRKIRKLDNVIFDNEYSKRHLIAITHGNDDCIIECAIKHNAIFVTGDYVAELKAKSNGVEVYNINDEENDYLGYVEVTMNDEEIAYFYENINENKYNLLVNQYIIIKNNNGEIIETAKWNGKEIKLAHQKGFTTDMFGKFKPYDPYQVCALDSLVNNQMTMLKGKPGSGKSLIALNYAWSQIEKGKYDKLILFVNPTAARNSSKLGYYPGTRTEKLIDSSVGSMLASKFGDLSQVEALINNNKILLLPFSDIRGFDSTGMRAIIWFVECQNLDIDLMKLGLQRCGSDSKIILDGDYYNQVDMTAYEGFNNGMRRVSEVFRGMDFYGEIMLPNIHRSKISEVADKL